MAGSIRPLLFYLRNHLYWSRCGCVSPHRIRIGIGIGIGIKIGIGRRPPFSDAASEAATESLVATGATSKSNRTMRRRLTTRGRGSRKMPLPLILILLTLLPLTPLLLTPLTLTLPFLTLPLLTLLLLSRRRRHWEAADMLVGKWDNAGANGNLYGWRRIFVSLVYRFWREIR